MYMYILPSKVCRNGQYLPEMTECSSCCNGAVAFYIFILYAKSLFESSTCKKKLPDPCFQYICIFLQWKMFT